MNNKLLNDFLEYVKACNGKPNINIETCRKLNWSADKVIFFFDYYNSIRDLYLVCESMYQISQEHNSLKDIDLDKVLKKVGVKRAISF